MPTPTFSGASYQLNPDNQNDSQNSPAVAALDDGRFATVYRSSDALGGTLRYVVHNADGSIFREQTIVDADNEVYIDNEMVNMAALDGGGFVITWSERLGADENIYHRVYGADGLPVTDPIQSNADWTDGVAKRPDVVGDGTGGFYLVWDDTSYDSDPGPGQAFTKTVRMQHFGADGQPIGPSERLSDSTGADSNAAIAISRDGSKVNVIWDDDLGNAGNHTDGIYGKVIGEDGFYRADKGDYSEFHSDPDVAYSTGNTFMSVWNEHVGGGNYAVYGSINGGDEFQINTSGHVLWGTMQKVVGLRDGNFLVVWYDGGHGGNDDVLGQLISGSGAKIGEEFVISDRVSTDIQRIEASETIDGRVIVTWSSSDGSSEIYGRMVDPRQGALDWTGDESSEHVAGTGFADTLNGGAGDDVIQGLGGADAIDGGAGSDTASYDLSTTGVLASLAKPSSNLGDALGDTFVLIENLTGSKQADTLIGDTAANTLRGLGGNDVMQGGDGADIISGGDGDDVLSGDGGSDFLEGGTGADVFLFSTLRDSAKGAFDTVMDFARGEDDIDLRRIDANEDLRGNQAFDFIGREKFHREAGELRYEAKGGSTFISGDTDGDGKADFLLVLEDVAKVKSGDFIL